MRQLLVAQPVIIPPSCSLSCARARVSPGLDRIPTYVLDLEILYKEKSMGNYEPNSTGENSIEVQQMRDEAYIESQRPGRMFAKILNDSRMFFAVARHAWDEAVCLIRKSKEKEDRRPANEISMDDDVDSLSVRAESALTVAMMNYTTSIELLMKAFLGVRGRFNEESLDEIRNKVRHESEKVLDHIPEGWGEELEGIYRAAEMAQIEIYPFYNDWNPPDDWIEDTKRLDTNTLREFLHFLRKERLNVDRYSFEKLECV